YLARGAGYTLALGRDGALLSLKSRDADGAREGQLRMSFPGARRDAHPAGLGLTETVSNYFKGSDPRRWVTGVENYARVVYAGIYEGVDLVFHETGGQVEYDFRLSPGADAHRVKVRFDGAERASVGTDGALILYTRAGELRQPKPFAYQEDGAGRRTRVACDYALNKSGEVGFRLGAYDRALSLVIDPVLVYSAVVGPLVSANGIAVDAAGNAYVAGTDTDGDVRVMKLNPTGSGLVYSAHVGGSGNDVGHSLALDAGGNVYVTGTTLSTNFPTSSDAFDKTCGSDGACDPSPSPGPRTDAFVFKLNPAGGALVYSTYLGGSGTEPIPSQVNWPSLPRISIALDAGGNAYVAGSTTSPDFPTTPGAFNTTPGGGFVTKLNPTGSALVYSTIFPAALPQAVAVDSDGNAYLTGMTGTGGGGQPPMPVVNAYQPTLGGEFTFDAFAAKLNASGSGVVFSTFLGGPEGQGDTPRGGDDYGSGVGVDAAGNVYVAGATRSGCFPTANPYVPPSNCQSGGGPKEFLVKFSPAGNTLLFSRKLSELTASGGDLKVAPSGVSTLAWTCQRATTGSDVCVNRVSPAGVTLFSTAFGGAGTDAVWSVAGDDAGAVYVGGQTFSPDYPTTPGALDQRSGVAFDAFVTKLSTASPEVEFVGGASGGASVVYQAAEGGGKVTVRVERSGDLAGAFAVDYTTADGSAKSTSDYAAASGTLNFAAFETVKTFDVFITDDAYGPEGVETFGVRLSNPTGGALLGEESEAVVHISDNDSSNGANPVVPPGFDPDFFVRQHYVDFLNREPDPNGFAFWKGEFAQCNGDAGCLDVKRVNVSAAFFLSIEFQETGYFAYRTYKAAFGDASSPGVEGLVPVVRLNEFLPDTRRIGEGVVVGQAGWEARLDANKGAYLLEFVARQRFLSAFPVSLTAEQFVERLDQGAGGVLSPGQSEQLIAELAPSPADPALRASVLRKVAEDAELRQREFNRAFVLMEYFGYLRRNPDEPPDGTYAGWKFWLDKLNQFGGNYVQAEMVKAFINSDEYRRRFGP
ncbi:MAG: SBBP repeat-containing protein, partial [Pyrinomonadaceae bacterium]